MPHWTLVIQPFDLETGEQGLCQDINAGLDYCQAMILVETYLQRIRADHFTVTLYAPLLWAAEKQFIHLEIGLVYRPVFMN